MHFCCCYFSFLFLPGSSRESDCKFIRIRINAALLSFHLFVLHTSSWFIWSLCSPAGWWWWSPGSGQWRGSLPAGLCCLFVLRVMVVVVPWQWSMTRVTSSWFMLSLFSPAGWWCWSPCGGQWLGHFQLVYVISLFSCRVMVVVPWQWPMTRVTSSWPAWSAGVTTALR